MAWCGSRNAAVADKRPPSPLHTRVLSNAGLSALKTSGIAEVTKEVRDKRWRGHGGEGNEYFEMYKA